MRFAKLSQRQQGFALPVALGLGIAMLLLGITLTMLAQNDRTTATNRRQAGTSVVVAEGGAARVMAVLSDRHNAILLARNYDPVNPQTGENYLGADGQPNSGDETATAIDEWTGYDPSPLPCFQQAGVTAPNLNFLSGTIGATGSYTLKAYRYNPAQQQGTILVEGRKTTTGGTANQPVAIVAITIAVKPDLDDFPSVLGMDPDYGGGLWAHGVIGLRSRVALGSKANVYYVPASSPDPALTADSALGEANRASYRNAIFAAPIQDGASSVSDPVGGEIAACRMNPTLPNITGTQLGDINTSRTLTGNVGIITRYRADQINLDGNETLTVNTTAGPVHLYINGDTTTFDPNALSLDDNAKILNIRTDGRQPRVGDFRLLVQGHYPIKLRDRSCIQTAFVYSPVDELRLLTSGAGCPSGRNTNFEGVLWVEAVLSAKNAGANRDIEFLDYTGEDYDTTVIPGVTAGIYVPDDLTSLVDLLPYLDWPARYQFGGIKSWQQVKL